MPERPPYDPATDSSPSSSGLDHPSFCRLELWDARSQSWTLAHAGISLLHPRRYVERMAANGKHGRVTLVDTGETFGDAPIASDLPGPAQPTETSQPAQPGPAPASTCPYCDETHAEPHDGMCLL